MTGQSTPADQPPESTAALAELVRHRLLDRASRKLALDLHPFLMFFFLPPFYFTFKSELDFLKGGSYWTAMRDARFSVETRRRLADRLHTDLVDQIKWVEGNWPELVRVQSPPLVARLDAQLKEIALQAADRLTAREGSNRKTVDWAIDRTADALHSLAGRPGLLRSRWIRLKYPMTARHLH